MSPFEITMLVCFGFSWPLAIYKTLKAKSAQGKSVPFLYLVIIGYLAGCLHKIFYNFDGVFFLYTFNGLMVVFDLIMTYYYLYFYPKKLLRTG